MKLLLTLALLLACVSPSIADNELTPHLGVRFGGEIEADSFNVESLELRPAVALTYDHRLRGQGWLWSAWSYQATEFDAPDLLTDRDSVDLDVHYLHVGTSYRGQDSGGAHGFVLVGLGFTWIDPQPSEFDSELGGSIVVGGGLRVPVKPRIDFRFDARGYATFTETRLDGLCDGVSCSIEFSGGGAFQVELLAGLAFDF